MLGLVFKTGVHDLLPTEWMQDISNCILSRMQQAAKVFQGV